MRKIYTYSFICITVQVYRMTMNIQNIQYMLNSSHRLSNKNLVIRIMQLRWIFIAHMASMIQQWTQ